ncbi:hypothetical protein BLOT_007381, partial [Blomia tropicalis]
MNISTIKILAICVKELYDLIQIKKQIKKRRIECRKRIYAKRRFAIKPGNDIPIYDDAFRRMPDDLFKMFQTSEYPKIYFYVELDRSPISIEQIILVGLKKKFSTLG